MNNHHHLKILALALVLAVQPARAGLVHRYSFDDTVSTTNAFDTVGGANGTLFPGATITGGQAVFDGVAGYIQLPNDLVLPDTNLTMEVWVTDNTQNTWSRVYDFGNGTPVNMFLTEHPGGTGLRFVLKQSDAVGEQRLDSAPIGAGVENHIVVTYNVTNHTGSMYVNGALVAQNTAMTTTPASMGTTPLDYLGRSQYAADSYFQGSINELRIYDVAVSALQAAVDDQLGPNTLYTDPGTPTSLTLNTNVVTTMNVGDVQSVQVTANFSTVTNINLTPTASYSSSATNILVVDSNGRIGAVGPGTASISAFYRGVTNSVSITVNAATVTMTHRYSFDDTNATDSIGAANGTLTGTATVTNGQLVLDGTTGTYLNLPPDLFTNYNGGITFEAWVTDNDSSAWARIYDFGNRDVNGNGSSYMFLALNGGGGIRGAYSLGAGEQVVDTSGRPVPGAPGHIVFSQNAITKTAAIYINGVQVAANTNFTFTPASVGPTANDWLGQSQFTADPAFHGSYDEFRVYNGALDPLQIAIDSATGPTNIVTNPGALQSIALSVGTNTMLLNLSQNASVLAAYANVANVPVTSIPPITYSSSNTNIVTVDANGVITAKGVGSATVTANFNGKSDNKVISVIQLPLTLAHRYSFDDTVSTTNAFDSVGGAHGTLFGNATVSGGQLRLDGSTLTYAQLPNGLLTNDASITMEAWVTDNAQATWSRVYDFGNGPPVNMFLTEHPGGVGLRFVLKQSDAVGEQQLNAAPIGAGVENHIVVTYNVINHTGTMYVNGVQVAQNTAMTTTPASLGTTLLNYLGRSQYSGQLGNDPYFNGSINELRIWSGAISLTQITVDYSLGPDTIFTNSLGALQALAINAPSSLVNGQAGSVSVLGTFANIPTTNIIVTGLYPIVYSSTDRSVVNVDAHGILTGGFPGTATITATYNGLSASADVTVTEPSPPVLDHRWSFDTVVNGNNVADSVGGDNGVLLGTATVSGGQLVLGTNGYVDIATNTPAGLFNGYNAVTLEAWANIGANPSGARHLFSIGDTLPAANYLRLRARSGGGNTILSYNTTVINTEFTAFRSSFLRGPFHIVAVYNPPPIGVMSLYLDGKLQATNTMVDPLGNIGAFVAYIGGSVVNAADPTWNASIDEFRIYNGALDLQRIRTSIAGGPTNQVMDAGTITSLALNVETNVIAGTLQEAHVAAGSASVSNIDLSATPSLANFTSSNTNIVSVAGDGRLLAVAPGSATVTATYRGATSNGKTITVVAAPSLALTHRYSFTGDASDSVGIANGRLYGQAAISGGSLVLDGANSYLELPEHMIDGYPSITLEAWATLNVNGTWARLWDIGSENIAGGGGLSYLYYTTHVNGTQSRLLINGGGGEISAEQVNATFTLEDTNQHHVVLTHDGPNHLESVYIDGNLIASTTVNTPLTNVADINTWIGKSQFNDPYLIGQVAEARIYYGVMSAAQVAGDFASGPDSVVPRPLVHVNASGGNLTISWPDTASGFILESSATMAAGSWSTVGALQTDSNGTISVTVPVSGARQFFRLRHP